MMMRDKSAVGGSAWVKGGDGEGCCSKSMFRWGSERSLMMERMKSRMMLALSCIRRAFIGLMNISDPITAVDLELMK